MTPVINQLHADSKHFRIVFKHAALQILRFLLKSSPNNNLYAFGYAVVVAQ